MKKIAGYITIWSVGLLLGAGVIINPYVTCGIAINAPVAIIFLAGLSIGLSFAWRAYK